MKFVSRKKLVHACFGISIFGALGFSSDVSAYRLKTLYSFCSLANCKDGQMPLSRPLLDVMGNVYVTASRGGAQGSGAVVELTPTRTGPWKEKLLHSFRNKNDGATPVAGVIMDVSGNLYGTAAQGGAVGAGAVYELVHDPDSGKWRLKVLHGFCFKNPQGCVDGQSPQAGLTYQGAALGALYDGASPLYGTTDYGGTGYGNNRLTLGGTVFQLTLDQGEWNESVLYNFCSQGGTECTDGEEIRGGLSVDPSGNLIGVSYFGGAHLAGNLFELSYSLQKAHWKRTTLHDFCSQDLCADGNGATSSPLQDPSGTIFDMTNGGGSPDTNCAQYFSASECGAIYKFNTKAPGKKELVLYSFCALENCADGAMPLGGLTMDASGNLFGTTSIGGTGETHGFGIGSGVVFELSGENYQVLYSFCTVGACTDGANPNSDVVVDSSGNIFGTTSAGGDHDMGTVFELSP